MSDKPSKLKIADREFTSRLLVGTGKFSSNESMRDALEASGTGLVTVALRRADLSGKGDPFANILDFIDPKRFLLLPNTSGARNAAGSRSGGGPCTKAKGRPLRPPTRTGP
jgi:thiazole synthase